MVKQYTDMVKQCPQEFCSIPTDVISKRVTYTILRMLQYFWTQDLHGIVAFTCKKRLNSAMVCSVKYIAVNKEALIRMRRNLWQI